MPSRQVGQYPTTYHPLAYQAETAFLRRLKKFGGILFLSTSRVGTIDEAVRSHFSLAVTIDVLNDAQRALIWKGLEKRLVDQRKDLQLSASARTFLDSKGVHLVNWNGHEILRCFQGAIALAELDAQDQKEIVVQDEHFKDVMNKAHAFRSYVQAIYDGHDDSQRARGSRLRNDRQRPLGRGKPVNVPPPAPGRPHGVGIPAMHRRAPPPREMTPDMVLNIETRVCTPDLNHVEWDEFKRPDKTELFQKTELHAIDVLVGEPLIKFEFRKNKGRRRRLTSLRSDIESTALPERSSKSRLERGQEPLPERIRINSSVIRKAFEDIYDEEDFLEFTPPGFDTSFLHFRPFRSLVYYEQEFRDWLAQREAQTPGK
jgi:hypothetical protein